MPVELIKNKLSLKKITPLHKAGLIASEKTAEHWFNLGRPESLDLYIYASGAYQSNRINPKDAISHNGLGVVYTVSRYTVCDQGTQKRYASSPLPESWQSWHAMQNQECQKKLWRLSKKRSG
jgi:hypothetical protein